MILSDTVHVTSMILSDTVHVTSMILSDTVHVASMILSDTVHVASMILSAAIVVIVLYTYIALNQPQEDSKCSSDNHFFALLLSISGIIWNYTCAVMAANVAHTNLPEYTPSSVVSH